MEDSGIDSGDKLNSICFDSEIVNKNDLIESDNSSNDNLEIVFRGGTSSSGTTAVNELNDKNYLNTNNTNNNNNHNKNNKTNNNKNQRYNDKYKQINTCKVLQRKLELKVERAKRNYNQLHDDKKEIKIKSSRLIPISKLQIPGCTENQPLVEYKSESDADDDFGVSFFPINKTKLNKTHDLSDTFSIQEMTIESDTDDSESQNLELLPPTSSDKFLEKLISFVCCTNPTKHN